MTEAAIAFVGFVLGWFSAVSSGVIFAFITYRTKREPHESLFSFGKPKGEAFVVDDFIDNPPVKGRVIQEEPDTAGSILDEMTEKFKAQLAAEKAMVKEKAE